MTFTDEDVKKAKEFAAVLAKAELRLPLDQYPKVYTLLVWYQQLTTKLEANVMELTRVVQPEPSKRKRKAT